MVKLTPEFKEKIKKEMKAQASPERGSSRKLLKTGGRKCVTLRPDWCRQWGLEAGSNVLLFVDENNKLVITPTSNLWREEMKKNYSVLERKIVEVGNSLAVSVPNDILKEELGWETRKLLRSSDYTTIYEPYDVERENPTPEQKPATTPKTTETGPEKPKSEGMRKSTKIVALSTVGLVIAMGVLIAQNPSPETGSLKVDDWTNGTFNNTAVAGGGIQLLPAFMENSQEGWTFTPDDNRYTSKNWTGWYTQGTGSVAVGSIDETIWLGRNESITATKTLDLSGVETLLIDIYGEKSHPEKYMTQQILIDGDIEFKRKNKSFKKMG